MQRAARQSPRGAGSAANALCGIKQSCPPLKLLPEAGVDESSGHVVDETRKVIVRALRLVVENVVNTDGDLCPVQQLAPFRPAVVEALRPAHPGVRAKLVRGLKVEEPCLTHPMFVAVRIDLMETVEIARGEDSIPSTPHPFEL